jgi:hypothetical protein
VAGEAGYTLQRSADAAFPADPTLTATVTLPANVTRHSDAGLTPLTTYHYRVRATNAAGDSGWSAVATTATPAVAAPNAPSHLAAKAHARRRGRADLGGHRRRRERVPHRAVGRRRADVQTIGSAGANATAYADADPALAPATAYSYRVFAYRTR